MNKINLNTYVSNIADVKIFDSVNTIIIDNHPKVVKSQTSTCNFFKKYRIISIINQNTYVGQNGKIW